MIDMKIYLLVDGRGWKSQLDPELINAVIQTRLQTKVEITARDSGPQWPQHLPQGAATVFLFLTERFPIGWKDTVRKWLDDSHILYAVYTDNVPVVDVRDLAGLTSKQRLPWAPYRIVQQSGTGLENAAKEVASTLDRLAETMAPAMVASLAIPLAGVIKTTPTRWRNLPSNRADPHAYPDEMTSSSQGAGGYTMVAASRRGKSHAHDGTFRDDAVALGVTPFWNIMAVADGAGTASYSRVGANMAVHAAVEAIRGAMPVVPTTSDLGRAIWAGLQAAHGALSGFAEGRSLPLTDLHTTLQLMIHAPQPRGCYVALLHVGDGIMAAQSANKYYLLTTPDSDPDDSSRTLFMTSAPIRKWMERTKVYDFDEPLDVITMMTDGISGDLEPYESEEVLRNMLFAPLQQRVLCYPLPQREKALLAFISYERRGSFDDRTLAVLSRG
jgi:Protein phosphatase 2C